MTAIVNKIEPLLKNAYDTKKYVEMLQEIFPAMNLVAPDKFRKEFTNFSSHIEGSIHIGNYKTTDKKQIIIMAVQLKKDGYVENARSTHRSYAKKLIANANADAAFIAFYTEDSPKWRLSFVRLDYEMKIENGRLKATENLTPAKRYSYLLGEHEPCHTAISQFKKFIVDSMTTPDYPTLDDLENVFSVEKVTDEFFKLYCEKYHQLREKLDANEDFCMEAAHHNFTSEQFAKKLMGQIVFLYFLQKKGWLGVKAWPVTMSEKEYNNVFYNCGKKVKELIPQVYIPIGDGVYKFYRKGMDALERDDKETLSRFVKGEPWGSGPHDFMRRLFVTAEKNNQNFYDDMLEPLFYTALNTNRGEHGYCHVLDCRMPFLSSGLFDPIDGYDWKNNNFNLPNELFSNAESKGRDADGILDIFDRYNFTMSEDEPMEREVAIDPEMLGKVFENLLEVRDRKSKGAFYTPREIVHYMCQESLINYLTHTVQIEEAAIREFILYGDFMREQDTEKTLWTKDASGKSHLEFDFNKELLISPQILSFKDNVNRLQDLDDALKHVRVADPAVGSGAFPLGMLNEIVRARENISAYMAITMKAYDIRMMYSFERSPYILKRETIKNCIFAADIEPSAVDIAQLRLWLSLVIDDEINPNAQNELEGHRNPLPLPNLDSNIVCGNSLIDEFEGVKLINESELLGNTTQHSQVAMNQGRFEAVVKKLIEKQNELFLCDETEKKKQLKAEIGSLKDTIILAQLEGSTPETIQHYHETKHDAALPYVLWQLEFAKVFREKGGFDIVIGNPPYIGESGHKDIFKTVAETEFGKRTYQGKMDFFYFFFHKGLDLLKEQGLCGLITTNYYISAAGAKTLRNDFKERANIFKLVNFNELKIFQSALGQHNIITFLQKGEQNIVSCCITNRKGNASANILNTIVQWRDSKTDYFCVMPDKLYDENGNIAFREEDSILAKTKARQNYQIDKKDIGGGIDILQECVVEKHLQIDPTLEVGKGIFAIKTDEIEALNFNECEKQIIKPYYTSEQIKKYVVKGLNQKWILYTNRYVCDHINEYPNIKKHLDKYQKIITSDNKPYGLHRPRDEKQFKGVKILSLRMTKEPCFTLAEQDTYVTRAYLTIKIKGMSYKYALALFNSELFYYWLFHMGKRKGKQLQIDQAQISELPMYIASECEQREINMLIESIQEELLHGNSVDEFEEQLNSMIYQLYGLNPTEIAKVRAFVKEQREL